MTNDFQEAVSKVSIDAYLGNRPDFGIRSFVTIQCPGVPNDAILGEEMPWVEIRGKNEWYLRGWFRLPRHLRKKLYFRAAKLLRRQNRREE